MTGQHVQSSTDLLGQCSILTGHCPLTGRYFKPRVWGHEAQRSEKLSWWFTSFSSLLPTSQVGYHTSKPLENVVFYFYKITLKHVSVFYDFTGTINYWFLTDQNARTILVIL